MCRSIVTLRHPDRSAEAEEIEAAALQFVRKISGYRHPSQKNEAAFSQAVADIAAASTRMLAAIGQPGGSPGGRTVASVGGQTGPQAGGRTGAHPGGRTRADA